MRRQEVLSVQLPALFRNSECVSAGSVLPDSCRTLATPGGPGESALMFNRAQEMPRTRAGEWLCDGR